MSNNNNTMNMASKDLLTLDNPVFCCYLFWATVLVAKMLLMSLLTALQRFRYKVTFFHFISNRRKSKVHNLTFHSCWASFHWVCGARYKDQSQVNQSTDSLSLTLQIFPNEEDLFFKNLEVKFDDPHVERVRR